MKLFSYESAKRDRKSFRSLTSLTVKEFEELCPIFGECWNELVKVEERDERKGGRKPILKTMEDRLFFILFYLKTYPLQEVLAFSFEMSQSEANRLVHQLSEVLRRALHKGGFTPPRLPEAMLARLDQEEGQEFSIDGTERAIVRPSNDAVQELFFSGKAGGHTVKNTLIVGLDDQQIKGLSGTHEGRKHDKTLCEEERLRLPDGSDGYLDGAFQGYEMPGVKLHRPQKKPRGGELPPEQQEGNRLIASIRVVVEHVISGVKRCRIVKDIFRNTLAGYDDEVMEITCGLHNFRSYHRQLAY